ncbi:hypothetical protein QQ73_11755, partial [Candidatus Endoriftia persephone str. Guaymas]|nr:hypothetical protein [Candidatus Endoriftia persephone str. Guaymas]
NGGAEETTGWRQVELNLGGLAAGRHRLIIGGYNSQKTAANETTEVLIDELLLSSGNSNLPPRTVVRRRPDGWCGAATGAVQQRRLHGP